MCRARERTARANPTEWLEVNKAVARISNEINVYVLLLRSVIEKGSGGFRERVGIKNKIVKYTIVKRWVEIKGKKLDGDDPCVKILLFLLLFDYYQDKSEENETMAMRS